MEQDFDGLYARAVVLAGQSRDASCVYLQRHLRIGWQLARRIHGRLIAEAAYLRQRHHEIKPDLPGRRLIRIFSAGSEGNAILAELGDQALKDAAVGFDTDSEGRLYLADECGHFVGRVALSGQSSQRLDLFEALARSSRIVMVAGDPDDPAGAALLPLLAQGARAAGAWVIRLQCQGRQSRLLPADRHADPVADLVVQAASFDIPGLDAGQVNTLAARRVLQMVEQEFGARAGDVHWPQETGDTPENKAGGETQ